MMGGSQGCGYLTSVNLFESAHPGVLLLKSSQLLERSIIIA